MSFTDADALINAVMARAAEAKAGAGAAAEPVSMDQLFTQMMGFAMEEIQKAQQNNTSLPRANFNAGYDAMLAGIDTTNNPELAKAIADYRGASTKEERDALNPILARELEKTAQTIERRAYDMLSRETSNEDDSNEDDSNKDDSKDKLDKPRKCSRFIDCNCDNSERPFNQLLHDLTDDAIEYVLDEAELNRELGQVDKAKQLSDSKRIDYFKDYIEKERISITDIIEKFIDEGCCGFTWEFLRDLPAFQEEITKHYKCCFLNGDINKCMVCVCYLNNKGWITNIQHPNLVPMEHYLGVMTKLITDAIDTQNTTNLNIIFNYFSKMPNFAHYHKLFKENVYKTDIIKNRLIKKWLQKH